MRAEIQDMRVAISLLRNEMEFYKELTSDARADYLKEHKGQEPPWLRPFVPSPA